MKNSIDIVKARKQADKALLYLDGSSEGLIAAKTAISNLIYAAYHLGKLGG